MPLTLAILSTKLLADCCPGDNEKFARLLTEADQRLLEAGNWQWTRRPLDLAVVDSHVTLPTGYASIVGCQVGSMARGVLWQEIEFLEGGPGVVPIQGLRGQLLDIGIVDEEGEQVRKYRCTGSQPADIVVLAKFAPIDLDQDGDYPRCQHFSAIKSMIFSILYEEANDLANAENYRSLALRTLNEQEATYRGAARKVFDPWLHGPPVRRRTRSNFP